MSITNDNEDFTISPEGMSIKQTGTFLSPNRSFSVEGRGGLWGSNTTAFLSLSAATDVNLNLHAGGLAGNRTLNMVATRITAQGNLRVRSVSESNRNTPTPQAGDIIFNTTTNKFNGWNGSEWRNLD